MAPMHESFRFLDLNGERLFAVLHAPERVSMRAVVMCPPLGEEKLWAHRVFVSCARDLAAAGCAVLRIDYRGEGDSDRAFEQSDLETRIEDVHLAVDTLRSLYPTVAEVNLIGLRFGAAVAAVASARRRDIARLVLWDPVTDGAAYMQAVLRLNLMFQMAQHRKVVENRDALVARLGRGETVNIEGYELAQPLFQQTSGFRLATALEAFGGQVLAIQVSQGEGEIRPDLAELAHADGRCRVVIAREEPFWKELKTFYRRATELTRLTLEALEAAP